MLPEAKKLDLDMSFAVKLYTGKWPVAVFLIRLHEQCGNRVNQNENSFHVTDDVTRMIYHEAGREGSSGWGDAAGDMRTIRRGKLLRLKETTDSLLGRLEAGDGNNEEKGKNPFRDYSDRDGCGVRGSARPGEGL